MRFQVAIDGFWQAHAAAPVVLTDAVMAGLNPRPGDVAFDLFCGVGLFVAAVRGGLLSLEEACARYTLTVDEFLSWQMSIDQHGLAGLRTTRLQQYRM